MTDWARVKDFGTATVGKRPLNTDPLLSAPIRSLHIGFSIIGASLQRPCIRGLGVRYLEHSVDHAIRCNEGDVDPKHHPSSERWP
jgi:hypothetical protein